jgi:hypothetical protein
MKQTQAADVKSLANRDVSGRVFALFFHVLARLSFAAAAGVMLNSPGTGCDRRKVRNADGRCATKRVIIHKSGALFRISKL